MKVKELIECLKKSNPESEVVIWEWEEEENATFVHIQKTDGVRPIHVLFPEKPYVRHGDMSARWNGRELGDSAFLQSFEDEKHAVECTLISS